MNHRASDHYANELQVMSDLVAVARDQLAKLDTAAEEMAPVVRVESLLAVLADRLDLLDHRMDLDQIEAHQAAQRGL